MAAYQVPSNYDPNAPTYKPGTQDDEENGAPNIGAVSAPKPYMPPTNTDYAAAPTPSMSTGTQKASDAPAPPQTFSQMQEQGIARPPAPTGGATLDPTTSGLQVAGAANTTGDANPQATPAQGMTTAQWDASSPLAGMNEQQLAQYWAGQGVTGLAYGATPTGVGANGVNTYNPAQVASNDATLAAQGQTLAPGVQAAQTAALGNYNATNTAVNDASNLASQTALNNALTNQVGYQQQYGATPTAAPAPFGAGFSPADRTPLPGTAGTSLTTQLPPQNSVQTPTDRPPTQGGTQPPSTSLPPQNPSQTPTGTTPSGGAYDVLNAITQGAQGQGGGSAVQNATQQKTLDLLNNPSPYNEAAVQDFYKTQAGNIDDQYALQQKALSEDMARRGLGNSTIFGGNLEDLNIGKRSAQTALSEDLAHQYAQSLGQYQTGAVNTGNTVGNTAQQAQQSWIQQLMGYGQNAFNNDLETNQTNQNASNNWQNYILQLLGMGYSPTG